MKNQVMFITLNTAFKSIKKIKKEEDKIKSFKFIIEKATSMLKLVNSRISKMESKTEKKLKRERDKIKLNQRIFKELNLEENKIIISKYLKDEYELFLKEFNELKSLLES